MKARVGLMVLVLALAGLIVTVIFIIVYSHPTEMEERAEGEEVPVFVAPGEESPRPEGPIQVSGTELTVSEEGRIIWRASFGGEIELDQKGRTARAEQVDWRFEGEGFQGLTITAPVMVADYNAGTLRFSGGVVIATEEGDLRFSANEVSYQFDTHKLIASGDVSFRQGAYSGRVRELVVDNRTKTLRLKQGELVRTQ